MGTTAKRGGVANVCLLSNIVASEESYVLRRAPRGHEVGKLSARHWKGPVLDPLM